MILNAFPKLNVMYSRKLTESFQMNKHWLFSRAIATPKHSLYTQPNRGPKGEVNACPFRKTL